MTQFSTSSANPWSCGRGPGCTRKRQLASITGVYGSRLVILASEKQVAAYQAVANLFRGNAYYWSSVDPLHTPGYAQKLDEFSTAVHQRGGLWIAPAAPGFDAKLVGGTRVIPRRDGQTLRLELNTAMDSSPDAIGLISWNEYSENSEVEPSREDGATALGVLASFEHAKPPVDCRLRLKRTGGVSCRTEPVRPSGGARRHPGRQPGRDHHEEAFSQMKSRAAARGRQASVLGGCSPGAPVPRLAAVPAAGTAASAAATCNTSSPAGNAYQVTLCISAPDAGATISGSTPVTGTISVTGTNPGVQELVFTLSGSGLIWDFQSPYTFSLDSTRWVDGTYSLQVYAIMRDGFNTAQTTEQPDVSATGSPRPRSTTTRSPRPPAARPRRGSRSWSRPPVTAPRDRPARAMW